MMRNGETCSPDEIRNKQLPSRVGDEVEDDIFMAGIGIVFYQADRNR